MSCNWGHGSQPGKVCRFAGEGGAWPTTVVREVLIPQLLLMARPGAHQVEGEGVTWAPKANPRRQKERGVAWAP